MEIIFYINFLNIIKIIYNYIIMNETEQLFDKLLNIIIEDDKNDGDVCNICHSKILDDKIQLPCSHYFHKKCIKYDVGNCVYCNKPFDLTINKLKIKCTSIIKTGPNKGKICGRLKCQYHKKDLNKYKIE